MIVRINGTALAQEPVVEVSKMQEVVKHVTSFGKVALPLSLGAGILNSSFYAKAAEVTVTTAKTAAIGTGLATKLQPLIGLVQDLALPVGICTAIWGVIELMLQNPAGSRKIKSSIIGFVAIYVIPTIFYAIHDGLQGGIA